MHNAQCTMHNLYCAMHDALLDYVIKAQRYKKKLIVNRCKQYFFCKFDFMQFYVVVYGFFSNFVVGFWGRDLGRDLLYFKRGFEGRAKVWLSYDEGYLKYAISFIWAQRGLIVFYRTFFNHFFSYDFI